jgi:hypothetical protein
VVDTHPHSYAKGACCIDWNFGCIGPKSPDAQVFRATQVQHALQHLGGDGGLGRLAFLRLRAGAATDDALPARQIGLDGAHHL